MLTLRRSLVLSSVVVFALVITLMVLSTYRVARQALEEEFVQMASASATLLAAAVAAPLAQRDLANVQELLEALVREQAFAYVELRDPRSGRPLAAAGDVALAAGITPTPAKGATPEALREARGAFH
ncbi:MAG: hypothetical protein N2483_04205, partial [Burkholderiaceae bacterium]|nr:hypothetical protein [Burkholderiaceae bacterium]